MADVPAAMRPRIAVVGLWHLGCVIAGCLADSEWPVLGLDSDRERIAALATRPPASLRAGLEELIAQRRPTGALAFGTVGDPAVAEAEIVWIAFDTPVDDEDRADVEWVLAESRARADRSPPRGARRLLLTAAVGSLAELARRMTRARDETISGSPACRRTSGSDARSRSSRAPTGSWPASGTSVTARNWSRSLAVHRPNRVDGRRVRGDDQACAQRLSGDLRRLHQRGRRHLRARRRRRRGGRPWAEERGADRPPRLPRPLAMRSPAAHWPATSSSLVGGRRARGSQRHSSTASRESNREHRGWAWRTLEDCSPDNGCVAAESRSGDSPISLARTPCADPRRCSLRPAEGRGRDGRCVRSGDL